MCIKPCCFRPPGGAHSDKRTPGAVRDFRSADRFVEVKGLAEREVMADLAIWPVSYMVSANTLDGLSTELERNDEAVLAYLASHGFEGSEISRTPPRINDQWSQAYGTQRPDTRYTAERTLTLRTGKVADTRTALQEATRLLEDGVVDRGVLPGPLSGPGSPGPLARRSRVRPGSVFSSGPEWRRRGPGRWRPGRCPPAHR